MKQQPAQPQIKYPRRLLIRKVLRVLAGLALSTLTEFRVIGKENFPATGPLFVVGNHFSFIDPVVMVRIAPWPIEPLAGFQTPNAPPIVRWIPKAWGVFLVHRGTASRDALRKAEAVIKQKGIVMIFPEGGSWATVLRPPRPGTAYLAVRTAAPILPIGIDGAPEVFPGLRRGRRTKLTIRVGRPFGPFHITGRGRERREQLDEIGHEIMRQIAQLIPPGQRGFYSADPAIRAAALGTEIYPWTDEPEV